MGQPLGGSEGGLRGHDLHVDGLNPVHNQPSERHVLRSESFNEVGRLAHRVWFGSGDNEEPSGVLLKETKRLIRTLPKSTEGRIDGRNEGSDIGEHLSAEDLPQNSREDSETGGCKPAQAATGSSGGRRENSDEATVQKRSQASGSVEEIQGTSGGRRVHHDQVPRGIGLRVQLPQFLHCHVFLRAGEGR